VLAESVLFASDYLSLFSIDSPVETRSVFRKIHKSCVCPEAEVRLYWCLLYTSYPDITYGSNISCRGRGVVCCIC
jgi:hypothetical protein